MLNIGRSRSQRAKSEKNATRIMTSQVRRFLRSKDIMKSTYFHYPVSVETINKFG
jgi:hypothetical protein